MFVVNNVLCYVVNKLRKSTDKILKSAVIDFYNVDALNDAKHRLQSDIQNLDLTCVSDDIPHVPERREGERRAARLADDIFTLLKFLDNNLLIDKLPKYVIDNPDDIPSTRVYDGDFGIMMKLLEKLDAKMSEHDGRLAAIDSNIGNLQVAVKSGVAPAPAPSASLVQQTSFSQPYLSHAQVVRSTVASRSLASTGPVLVGPQPAQANSRLPIGTSVCTPTPARLTNENNAPSVMVSMSTPGAAINNPTLSRYSRVPALRRVQVQSTDGTDSEQSHDEGQFTDVAPRRRGRVRRRSQTQSSSQTHNRNNTAASNTYSRPRPGTTLLIGRGQNNTGNVMAAKPPTRAVLYVDNLKRGCTSDELALFVQSLSVEVFSCYSTTPRHRAGQSPDSNRAAFRLCVAKRDMKKMLQESLWPDNVHISRWYHIDPSTSNKRGRYTSPPNANEGNETSTPQDMDATLTREYHDAPQEINTDNDDDNSAQQTPQQTVQNDDEQEQ